MENEPKITVVSSKGKPPFSKLKKQLESLFDPSLNMQFCCSAYPLRSKTGYASNSIPRFYVKLGMEIIWDYPKDFPVKDINYAFGADDNGISDIVREYIETPVKGLLECEFEGENRECDGLKISYGLTDLFKAADRRIDKRKLADHFFLFKNYATIKVVARRLYPEEF